MEPESRETSQPEAAPEASRVGMRATLIAILTSAALAAVKILGGVIGNSHALIADGVESILDIFSSAVVWGSLKIASLPPDENHPYGHGKAETLGALVVALAMLIAATGIAIQSAREILEPQEAPAAFTLVILVLVILTKELTFRFLRNTGQAIRSSALETDAWHHRSDALTSAAAFLGIGISLVAGEGYESADDWAALFACGIIAYNGVRLLRKALNEVMDAAPSTEVEAEIRRVSESVEEVRAIETCRVRKSGLSLFVDLHVVVDGGLTVRRGHEIAHVVKAALLDADLGVADVTVHIEPSSS